MKAKQPANTLNNGTYFIFRINKVRKFYLAEQVNLSLFVSRREIEKKMYDNCVWNENGF